MTANRQAQKLEHTRKTIEQRHHYPRPVCSVSSEGGDRSMPAEPREGVSMKRRRPDPSRRQVDALVENIFAPDPDQVR